MISRSLTSLESGLFLEYNIDFDKTTVSGFRSKSRPKDPLKKWVRGGALRNKFEPFLPNFNGFLLTFGEAEISLTFLLRMVPP